MSNLINRLIIGRNLLRFRLVNSSLYRDFLAP